MRRPTAAVIWRPTATAPTPVARSFPDRCKDVPLKKKPTEYLRQLYYDTIIFTPEALAYLASRVGAGQIMLGTDYPFPWAKGARPWTTS